MRRAAGGALLLATLVLAAGAAEAGLRLAWPGEDAVFRVIHRYPSGLALVDDPDVAEAARTVGLNELRFDPKEALPAELAASLAGETEDTPGGGRLLLVQFVGPIDPRWKAGLLSGGVEVIDYIPHDAYLVWDPTGASDVLRALLEVRAVTDYPPTLKLTPDVRGLRGGSGEARLLVGLRRAPDGTSVEAAIARLSRIGASIESHEPLLGQELLTLVVGAGQIDDLARDPEVVSVSLLLPKEPDGEVSKRIIDGSAPSGTTLAGPGYEGFLAAKGVDGTGVTVGVIDTGVDVADASGHMSGRVLSVLRGASEGGTGHGHHVAGIVGGHCTHAPDADGYRWGSGVAPGVAILNIPALRPGYTGDDRESVRDIVTTPGTNGVRGSIASCSWNSGFGGDYTALEREWDAFVRDADDLTPGNQPLAISFSSGNSGPGRGSLTRPHAAKNLVVVGSSSSLRPALGAPDWNQMALTSSRGPAGDGRIRPDLVAPGQAIASAQVGSYNCAMPSIDAQHVYCSGTSMAQPHVAGAAALFSQWWGRSRGGAVPSPALLKAALVSGARDLAPLPEGPPFATDHAPNFDEGFGLLDLDRTIAPAVPTLHDDETVTLGGTGEEHRLELALADAAAPFGATLAWTDAPGAVGAAPALVNDLDLVLESAAGTWIGNRFREGATEPGPGPADHLNNVERIAIPGLLDDVYTLRVRATSLPGDGVPGNASATDQDFALVVTNAVLPAEDGRVRLTGARVRCGTSVAAFVHDTGVAGPVPVTLASTTEPLGEVVSLVPVSAGSRFFRGTIVLQTGAPAADGRLQVADGDAVTVTYVDADDGRGGINVTKTARAEVDCAPPRVTNVRVAALTDGSATIAWETDEPATGGVAILGGAVVGSPVLATAHQVTALGLASCTRYLFDVRAEDPAGNQATETNGGAHFALTTWGRDAVLAADFEASDAGFTHFGPLDVWAWGAPIVEGPPTAASGDRLWGTALAAKYPKRGNAAPNGDMILLSPEIDLTGRTGAWLRMKLWYDIATDGSTDDGAWVQVWDGTRFAFLTPLGGYGGSIDDDAPLPGDATGGALAGSSPGWVERTFDLAAYDGQRIRFEVHLFEEDSFLGGAPGLYIDDVEVFTFATCGRGTLATPLVHVAACGGSLPLELRDADLNLDPAVAESASVRVVSGTEAWGEDVSLVETGPNTSVFQAALALVRDSPRPDGALQVVDADEARVSYLDLDDGSGRQATVEKSVAIDCRPPLVGGVAATPLSDREVLVSWTTDEPSTSLVRFGSAALERTLDDRTLVREHRVRLQDLDACALLSFAVESADAAGNRALVPPPPGVHATRLPRGNGVAFADDFELDRGWVLGGEWERGRPQGERFATSTSMDPNAALSRVSALGIDLTGRGMRPGDYEPGILLEQAVSPPLDLSLLAGVELGFARWLGVDRGDRAALEVSVDGGFNYLPVWQSPATSDVNDRFWVPAVFDLTSIAARRPDVRLRFTLSSDASSEFMGWQVDDLIVRDPALPPYAACGSTLAVASVLVDDAAGDGDGMADPGETVGLTLGLVNGGTAAATGVTARLASGREGVATFLRDLAAFPDLPAGGGTGLSAPPGPLLAVSAQAVCGSVIPITLAAESADGARATAAFSLPVGSAPVLRRAYGTASSPVFVPDLDSHGVVQTLDVAEREPLVDLAVTVELDHPDAGDLVVTLVSPGGEVVTLHDGSRSGQPYTPVTYPTGLLPDGPGSLSDFSGRSPAGTWSLRVLDARAGSTGTLRSSGLEVTTHDPQSAVTGPVTSPLLLVRSGADILASFGPAPGAQAHVLGRSLSPALAPLDVVASGPGATLVAVDALLAPGSHFYVVRGIDGCGREGP